MVQYSEHQRNKRSNKAEMKEPDKAADNVFSFEKYHINFILETITHICGKAHSNLGVNL